MFQLSLYVDFTRINKDVKKAPPENYLAISEKLALLRACTHLIRL